MAKMSVLRGESKIAGTRLAMSKTCIRKIKILPFWQILQDGGNQYDGLPQREEHPGGPGQAGDAWDPRMVSEMMILLLQFEFMSLIKHLFTG